MVISCTNDRSGSAGPSLHTVTYNGNDQDSGIVPLDTGLYYAGDLVDVKSNSGSLIRADCIFNGWNIMADGSGSNYQPGDTLIMGSSNAVLYANWQYDDPYNLNVGDTGPAGGIIGYLNPDPVTTGWKYVEVALPVYEQTGYLWGPLSNEVGMPDFNREAGYDLTNTALITAAYPGSNYAANYCAALVVTNNGTNFNDWVLPASETLLFLYDNLQTNAAANFSPSIYWSSSEIDDNYAWTVNFNNRNNWGIYKNSSRIVRPVRIF